MMRLQVLENRLRSSLPTTPFVHQMQGKLRRSAMDFNVAEQVLEELLPSLEALETQSAAILQFLKDRGIATDAQLAPYLEQAGNASSVRWRAASLRMKSILSSAMKSAEQSSRGRIRSRRPPDRTRAKAARTKGCCLKNWPSTQHWRRHANRDEGSNNSSFLTRLQSKMSWHTAERPRRPYHGRPRQT
jgi:hypothetical protein